MPRTKLRLLHARVLKALVENGPVLTRIQMAKFAGYSRGAGTINRVLQGIKEGSSTGPPETGLIGHGFVEKIAGGTGGLRAIRYRITQDGRDALDQFLRESGDLPPVRDRESFVNLRYRGAVETPPRFAEESDIEGTKSEFRSFRSRRSRRLRDTAFEAANGICEVCRRNFGQLLGGRGIRVLEVHHLKQLSSHDSPVITRLSDLVVVCANCHLLLHLDSDQPLSIDELREMLKSDGYLAR